MVTERQVAAFRRLTSLSDDGQTISKRMRKRINQPTFDRQLVILNLIFDLIKFRLTFQSLLFLIIAIISSKFKVSKTPLSLRWFKLFKR